MGYAAQLPSGGTRRAYPRVHGERRTDRRPDGGASMNPLEQFDPGGAGFGAVALLFPVLVIGVVVVCVLVYRANQRRVAALQEFVARNGWTWLGDDNRWVDAWRVAPFGRGEGRRVRECVAGEYRQVPFLSFTYEYYTESTSRDANGNMQTTRDWHHFDVAVLRIGAPIPDLHLSPEGIMSRIVDGFTRRDIDLESDAFNRAFRLRCADRKFAMDVFSARAMEYVLSRHPVSFDFTGGDALMWRDRRRSSAPQVWGPGDPTVPVEQGTEPFDVMLTVLTGIPDFVWQDRGGKPAVLSRGMR